MKLIIVFDDRDYNYEIPFKKIAKRLGVTEEQVIDVVKEVLLTT